MAIKTLRFTVHLTVDEEADPIQVADQLLDHLCASEEEWYHCRAEWAEEA